MEITGIQPVNAPLYGESAFGQKRDAPDVEGRADPIGESSHGHSGPLDNRSVERGGAAGSDNLTEEERREVTDLKQRDQEVKQHESAHLSAAGSLATSGASYEYRVGPDGKRYAVGGEVQIDVSKVSGDPQATIQKARQIRSAALAPKQPSGADRSIAARASQMEAEARQELSQEKIKGEEEGTEAAEKPEAPAPADPATEGPVSGEPIGASEAGAPFGPDPAGAGEPPSPGEAPAGPEPILPPPPPPPPSNPTIVEPGAFIDLFA